MRYAIISDIHSNLEALQAVLKTIEQEKIDKIVCLGDVVGYGPYPNQCIELVQQNCEIILMGNHDFACIESSELYYFNQYAARVIEWTTTVLSEKSLQFLAGLPMFETVENIFLVHANLIEPKSWDYVLTLEEAISNFSKFNDNTRICFIGHSHHPIIYIEYLANEIEKYDQMLVNQTQIDETSHYIINVGSVGQPRDGNPDAAYGIVDTDTKQYELKRVRYDVKKTFEEIVSAGLPQFLADRLLIGK